MVYKIFDHLTIVELYGYMTDISNSKAFHGLFYDCYKNLKKKA